MLYVSTDKQLPVYIEAKFYISLKTQKRNSDVYSPFVLINGVKK